MYTIQAQQAHVDGTFPSDRINQLHGQLKFVGTKAGPLGPPPSGTTLFDSLNATNNTNSNKARR